MSTVRITSGLVRPFKFGTALTTAVPANSVAIPKESPWATFQLISAAAATCIIQGSNEDLTSVGTNSNWVALGTITLTGAGTDGFTTEAPWRWVRASVTVASATTSVLMGV